MNNISNTRYVGTSALGLRMPIIKEGDNLVQIICEKLVEAQNSTYQPLKIDNKDIIAVTESLVARAQGNYVSLDDIGFDVSQKFPEGDVAIAFPILSRNRFATVLDGLTRGVKGKVYLFLSYPADEVGNPLMDEQKMIEEGINPYTDVLSKEEYYARLGFYRHPITQSNHVQMYSEISPKIEVVLANNPIDILKYTNQVIIASIHKRNSQKKTLELAGAKVYTLADICNKPTRHGMGYNAEFGVLGSNYSNENKVKLFPTGCNEFVHEVQNEILQKTGKKVEVMVYGDGAFKDPQHGIWELADPVVSPGYTDGLNGMPNEIKIKAIADINGENAEEAVKKAIGAKTNASSAAAIGTTPRNITDLVGSLCDLTSGSGDKGTPVVVVKGYFDSYLDSIPA